ncbi:hypothetical protein ABG79_02004 [Caloramator mitchellensis]|uniref:DUF2975 domain-containing protein n=1 Tax=Caloramator mitchellensis TaxID=908809 RepID=A0A0R3JRP7_CALMK|nr:DUF2975 domain-containing protein [Caloramator mitchellensis]KRQ86163.1 hypothetical protein ABG79_02004 [Caloramator mitchellensis]
MRRETLFLKTVIFLIGIFVLGLCVIGLPIAAIEAARIYPKFIYIPIFAGLYSSAIPFLFALYQAIKILNYIDKNKAFSDLSVNALKFIKQCAVIISIIYISIMPFLYVIGEKDDAPGIILIGLIIIFASFVVAVFAAVLQKLLEKAIEIKSENDLTI